MTRPPSANQHCRIGYHLRINTSCIYISSRVNGWVSGKWCTLGHACDECRSPRPNQRSISHSEKKKKRVRCCGPAIHHIHESWIMTYAPRSSAALQFTQHMKVLDVKSSAKQQKRCQSTIISGTTEHNIMCSVVNPKRQKKKLLTRADAIGSTFVRT